MVVAANTVVGAAVVVVSAAVVVVASVVVVSYSHYSGDSWQKSSSQSTRMPTPLPLATGTNS